LKCFCNVGFAKHLPFRDFVKGSLFTKSEADEKQKKIKKCYLGESVWTVSWSPSDIYRGLR